MDLVIRLLQNVREGFIHGQHTAAVVFDAEKAYDRVNQSLLLLKLQRKGVGGAIYAWLRQFLLHRCIRTKVNQIFSNYLPLNQGVPQGSSLSCLLFVIYVDDLLNHIHTHRALYADDLECHSTALP